jgi:hypothetical protein
MFDGSYYASVINNTALYLRIGFKFDAEFSLLLVNNAVDRCHFCTVYSIDYSLSGLVYSFVFMP